MAATGYTGINSAGLVKITGDTMTGELILPDSSPDTSLAAASKGYVDNVTAILSGGGDGMSVKFREVTIADSGAIGDLPAAAAWTICTTAGGTQLKCSIPAAVGDRIKVCGDFMRSGSRFLDWAILTSAGAIHKYATTKTTTPGVEGNPTMYPSLSFPAVVSGPVFTVEAGQISGGQVTVALANKGTGVGVIYAHPTYPWKLRLENYGPEPS